jgi:acid phosphatase (class A)
MPGSNIMPGLTRRAVIGAAMAFAAGLAQPALAEEGQPYFGPEAVDLSVLLVPPPATGSTAARAELDELKALQAAASEDRKQQAIADAGRNYQRFAATTSLAAVDAARLPLTVALIQRVLDTVEAVTAPAKRFFNRPRPPLEDATITPLIKLPDSPAYPSGHATFATATAIVLSAMAPEKRAELMARAASFAESRLVAGVHHPTDIGAGFASGALIAQKLAEDAAFQADLATARAELRAALGLN